MRTILSTLLVCLVAQAANAAEAPLSASELAAEADLIVIGTVTKIRMSNELSQTDPGRGNDDWAIYLTIQVDTLERGALELDNIEARFFRIRTRSSYQGFLSPNGHDPIPNVGRQVRLYLQQSPQSPKIWHVVLPNGASPIDGSDSLPPQARLMIGPGTYTYWMPVEVWWLLALAVLALLLVVFGLRRLKVHRSSAERAID